MPTLLVAERPAMRLSNKRPLTGRLRGSARLLNGRCCLEFEGQRFVPAGEPGREYWLEIADHIRASLDELQPRGWLEWDEFEIEFYGSLEWVGWGCGPLGVFGGIARIDKVVSAVFSAPPPAAASEAETFASAMRARKPFNSRASARDIKQGVARH